MPVDRLNVKYWCRDALMLAAGLPWHTKIDAPFHCRSKTILPANAPFLTAQAASDLCLGPAVVRAMEERSPPHKAPMEMPPLGDGWIDSYRGVTCRAVLGHDFVADAPMLLLDFEFSALSCDVPLYHWLGAEAEAA